MHAPNSQEEMVGFFLNGQWKIRGVLVRSYLAFRQLTTQKILSPRTASEYDECNAEQRITATSVQCGQLSTKRKNMLERTGPRKNKPEAQHEPLSTFKSP